MHPDDERARRALRDDERVFALLNALDHPPPKVTARDVMLRHRARQQRRARRLAAAVAVAVAGTGVAYAAPGSPVREWVRAAVTGRLSTGRIPETPPTAAPNTQVGEAPMSGVAIVPGERFRIEFVARQAIGEIRVALTDAAEVSVTASAGGANYTAEADRLVIDNRGGSASFDVALPRRAERIDVVVAGRSVLAKTGGRVAAPGATLGQGRYVVTLGR